jgi:hypothetical protein
MTRDEWLTAGDVRPMLEHVRGRAADRKLRLFAVACCRRVWPLVRAEVWGRAVAVADGYADGRCSETELRDAGWPAHGASRVVTAGPTVREAHADRAAAAAEAAAAATSYRTRVWPDTSESYFAAVVAAQHAALAAKFATRAAGGAGRPAAKRERRVQAGLLRDVFGPRLPPACLPTAWRTSAVVGLAEAIYEGRAFDRLPILTDALEEAGCADPDYLDHCRGGGPHVRGCWVVDVILGKGWSLPPRR